MKGIQDTSSVTFRQIMGNGLSYEIPKFQRDYTWDIEQWDDLWHDINVLKKKEESDHYMGYVVLQTSDNKNFTVIDGQQRLTTLSIIVLAVLRSLQDLIAKDTDPESNNKRIETLRNSYIGYVDPVTLISYNKLKLNRNSDDYYRQSLVILKELPTRGLNSSEKQMKDCHNWFYNKIKNEFTTGESLAAFIDDIADRLFFTKISVSDDFNAFRVFETLNARGVQLSSADLLKNYLFSVVDSSKPHKSEIEELENIWTKIIGKLGNQKLEEYLRFYWNSKHKTVRKNALFKTIRKNINDKTAAFELIRDLNDTADIYMAFQNPDDELWAEIPEIKESLEELKLFQIKQTLSLFIAAYKNLPDKEFYKLIKACVIISFRYNVIGGLNPNEQEETYNNLALSINDTKRFNVSELKSIYVEDANFENSFANKTFKNTTRNNKIVKYILSKIERQTYGNDLSSDSDLYTIEHILPENAPDILENFEADQINRCLYKLGNLTLLEKSLNRDAGNLNFEMKIDYYKKSKSKITYEISEKFENWNEKNIVTRQKTLAKKAKTVWKIQF